MQVEFTITRKDYINFYRQYYVQAQKEIAVLVTGIFVLMAMLLMHDIGEIVLYLLITLAIVYFEPIILAAIRVKRMALEQPDIFSLTTITITDEGLLITKGDQYAVSNWGTILEVSHLKTITVIRLINKKVILIPDVAFTGEWDILNFSGAIRSKMTVPEVAAKARPPYSVGLLSIVPFVGAVTGLALVYQGIFKYKNIVLVMLGMIGIVFTVVVYFMFAGMEAENTTNSKRYAQKVFEKWAVEDMNALVKEIEFYKLQHEAYPDNLEQLVVNKNDNVEIYDPLSNSHNAIFNYQKVGKKYKLFSSGKDQLPGTSDDIYPSLKIDTSKVGLIVK